MVRSNDPRMGYDYEKKKREQEQKKPIIKTDGWECVVCKKKIPLGSMTPNQRAYSMKNGAHCLECWEKKTSIGKPWLRKK